MSEQDGLTPPPGKMPISENKPINSGWLQWFDEVKKWSHRINSIREDNTANPPTNAQLDTAFGTPESVGNGFVGLLEDAGAGAAVYLCIARNSDWWYATLTKAV